jgi:hypothetical protein
MRARLLRLWPAALAAGAGLAIALLFSAPESDAQPPPPDPSAGAAPADEPAPPKGVDVQTRGPIHEAFATPTAEAQATAPVGKAPPKPIEEMPPEQKPEGNAVWIGGYWAWDDERKDYLWVSGVWRVEPPGKHWVAGYWREDGDKWQWVPGFWSEAQEAADKQDVTYMPQPPDPPQTAAPGAAPNADSFYVPGQWVWRGEGYAWRAGYWARVQTGYVWVPAHFRWTPYGYVYIAGYWDLALAGRGIMYAPVVVDPDVVTVGFVYTPVYVVPSVVVMDAFFVRPGYCHYYYGDYYGPAYHDCGFQTVVVYNRTHYDAVFVYERWDHRADPRWEINQVNIYEQRTAGRAPLPPRTLAEYNRYGAGRGLTVASAPRVAAMTGTRMVKLDAAQRAQVQQHAQAVRQVAQQRRATEAKLSPGVPKQPRVASVGMPKGYAPAASHTSQPATQHTSAPPARGTTTAPHPPGTGTPNNPSARGKQPPGKQPPAKRPPPKQPPGKEPPEHRQP